jgi:hypothetical protein
MMKTTTIFTDRAKELDKKIEEFAKENDLTLQKTVPGDHYKLQAKKDPSVVRAELTEWNVYLDYYKEDVGFSYIQIRRIDTNAEVFTLPINVLNEFLNAVADAKFKTFQELGIYE